MTQSNQQQTTVSERRIKSSTVRDICGGVSDMWLWRRLKDDPTFPRPVYVSRRRYWREAEVREWWETQPTREELSIQN